MTITNRTARTLGMMALVALAPLAGACNRLLDVTNPSAITDGDLTGDDATITFMANGVQGDFRHEYAWLAAHGAMFTDEAIQGHPWSPWNVYDQRSIPPGGAAYDGLSYQLLQRGRGTADIMLPRMVAALGAKAASSVALAKSYAYGGYSYIMVADYMCESPVNVSRAYSQAELYQMAVDKLDSARTIATAAKSAGKAGADEVLSLANVGLARAKLDLGDKAGAIAAAQAVPAGFIAQVKYTSDPSDWQVYDFYNWFAGERYAGEMDMAIDPKWATVQDARMPFNDSLTRLGDGQRDGHRPFLAASFSEWTPNNHTMFKETTAIRFASDLEALYIIAEAGGMSAGQLRTFVDSRRAVGGQAPFAGTDPQLAAELRDQRARDFFLDGHRMGDLRRYKAQYSVDLWPKGQMPGLSTQYGTDECWPIAASEVSSNPNLQH